MSTSPRVIACAQPAARVIIAEEEPTFEERKTQLQQQLVTATINEDSAINMAKIATAHKDEILQTLHKLIKDQEKELRVRRMRELEENDAVKAYKEALAEDKTRTKRVGDGSKGGGLVHCEFCGRELTLHKMNRHLRENKSCLAIRALE